MWRLRKGNGPPLLFSIRQLKAIVFDIWAVEGDGQASIDTQRFTRLFTVLILCTKPTLPHHGTHIDRAAHASGSKGGFGNSSGGGGEGGDSGGGGGGGGPHSDGPMPVPVPPVLPQRFFSAGGADQKSREEPTVGRIKSAPSRESDSLRSSLAAESPAVPQNPVLLALQLATKCEAESKRKARDRLVCERLGDAATTFEHLACGILDCAARAAIQAEERKQYNPWRMGTGHIHPEVAWDLFVNECIEHAAEHAMKIFIAHPLVYMQLHELFWPTSELKRAVLPADSGGCAFGSPASRGTTTRSRALSSSSSSSTRSMDDSMSSSMRSSMGSESPMGFEEDSELSSCGRHGHPDGGRSSSYEWWATAGLMAVLNLAVVPLLPFVPHMIEHDLEELLRLRVTRGELPMGIVWLLPLGRSLAWCCSALALACIVTKLPAAEASPSAWDVALLLYAAGWIYCERREYMNDVRKYGKSGRRKYLHDPFNMLDLLMILLMTLLLLTRTATSLSGPGYALWAHLLGNGHGVLAVWGHAAHECIAAAAVPCQALLALLSSLRIMELLFLFPQTGPLLLMAIRMLQDLIQFLVLFSFVVVSFGCAFFVLLNAAGVRVPADPRLPALQPHRRLMAGTAADGLAASSSALYDGGEGGGDDDDDELSVLAVVRILVQGTLKGESDFVLETVRAESPVAWGLMFLFGVVVVLLLLNLLIARFAKTFDMVYENVEHNFKVAFARVVMDGYNKELLPPPLNLLRALVLLVYSCLGRNSLVLGASHRLARDVSFLCDAEPGTVAFVLAHWLGGGGDDGSGEHGGGGRGGGGGGRSGDRDGSPTHLRLHPATGAPPYHLLGSPRRAPPGQHLLQRRRSSQNYDEEQREEDAAVAREVAAFVRKASDAHVAMLPEDVVEYVVSHQHDVAREERWRTSMQKEISSVEQRMRQLSAAGPLATKAQLESLERLLGRLEAAAPRPGHYNEGEGGVAAMRVKDLEATVEALSEQLDLHRNKTTCLSPSALTGEGLDTSSAGGSSSAGEASRAARVFA